jgi:SAM-dependent methyltransferase
VILCPECRNPYAGFDAARCLFCDWELETRDGLPVMLAPRDRRDRAFDEPLAHHDERNREEAFLEARAERMARLVGPVLDLDVCDVSVGQARLLDRLRGGGPASVTAIDVAPAPSRRLRDDGARVLVANVENLPFRGEFDVLIAADLLEHVRNPTGVLACVHEALRGPGRLVVRVPYREDLQSSGRLSDTPYRFVNLRSFTRGALRLMLERAGFEVERLVLDGFSRARVRPGIQRSEHVLRTFNRFMDRRYATSAHVQRMNDLLGRVLLQPTTLTAVARRGAERR